MSPQVLVERSAEDSKLLILRRLAHQEKAASSLVHAHSSFNITIMWTIKVLTSMALSSIG